MKRKSMMKWRNKIIYNSTIDLKIWYFAYQHEHEQSKNCNHYFLCVPMYDKDILQCVIYVDRDKCTNSMYGKYNVWMAMLGAAYIE